jgi:protein required for attachment to host cells
MQLPKGAIVAVADGEKLRLFRNSGDEADMKLAALPDESVDGDNRGTAHHSSSSNPDDSQASEDGFAAGTAAVLNQHALGGKVHALVIIAAPRTLGELRKHYHKTLTAILTKEIAKELTGHTVHDIEKTLAAA